MSMSERLEPVPGEWIDRRQKVGFRFEGRGYEGYAGDTVSSALLACGVRLLGRSFKYHRPRGVLSHANHDANVVVQNGPEPNVRADVAPLVEGMDLRAVNTFGGLRGDRAAVLDALSAFLPVGFYYKAFHSRRWFPRWERLIRRVAGLGEVRKLGAPIATPKRYDFCDVLVVGAGPSGLSAALAAAEAGAKVVLVDENARCGGSGSYAGRDEGFEATQRLVERVARHPAISVRCRTVAAAYYADHWVPLVDPSRMTKLRARAVVFCTGAFELPAVFRNNDLPGVMLASAARQLIHRYAVRPFRTAVVLAANSDGYRAALDFAEHGVRVAAIVDLRSDGERTPLREAAAARGIAIHAGAFVRSAIGRHGLSAVEWAPMDGGRGTQIACDGLAMSVGYAPASNLLSLAGTRMRYDADLEQFVPRTLPDGVFAAGKVRGVYRFEDRLLDGASAGRAAARRCGYATADAPAAVAPGAERPNHPYPVFEHPKGKNFVDFDEDVSLADVRNAAQEGFDSIELLKRFTTIGMGPSQGKHSNMNTIRILARTRGEPVEAVGATTTRPFYHPVPMSILAGRRFHAERRTPIHDRHAALGARFMTAGAWWRPEYYARAGESREESIRAEASAVRNGVGIIDVGTLGKIEVTGPQAAELLERVYTGRFADLRVGMTRYCLMTDEAGVIIDDGVVARIGPQSFYFTTTTSGSDAVYRELSRLNASWRLDCGIVNLTGQMGAVNVAGPQSRRLLRELVGDAVSERDFPYLAVRELSLGGVAVRAMRVGFVGELGYELHAPAGSMPALWDALMRAGSALGIRPFGVEAQRLLRLEKGHLIVGQDTDGLTSPFEAGCAWAVKMDKPFFIGQRSLRILQSTGPRQLLVGFTVPDPETGARVLESHLAIEGKEIAGRVTSVAWSPALSRHVGLALLRPDIAARGGSFRIRVAGGELAVAEIAPTPFYDPKALRQKEALDG